MIGMRDSVTQEDWDWERDRESGLDRGKKWTE